MARCPGCQEELPSVGSGELLLYCPSCGSKLQAHVERPAAGASLGSRNRDRFHKTALKLINGTMRRESPFELSERLGKALYGSLAGSLALMALLLAALLTNSFNTLLLAALPPAVLPAPFLVLAFFFTMEVLWTCL